MHIHKNNYESWFLDYHEGNLDANQRAAVMAFLEKNPELNDAFYAFEAISINSSPHAEEVYPFRDELHKSDSLCAWNLQEWLVAALEGDLELSQQKELERFLAENPSLLREQELLARTRLKADTSEVYVDKTKLHRAEVILVWRNTRILRYAAILLLLSVSAYTIRKLANDKPLPVFANEQGSSATTPALKVENDAASAEAGTPAAVQTKPAYSTYKTEGSKSEKPSQSKTEKHLQDLYQAGTLAAMPTRPVHLSELIPESQPLYASSIESITPTSLPIAVEDDTEALNTEQLHDEILEASFDGLTAEAGNEEIHKAVAPSRLPLFSRILRYTAKSVSRISGNRIQVRTVFNPVTGNIAACEVETGGRSWQRHF